MSRPRLAILGSGALGGFYGGLLARYATDRVEVHFLMRSGYEHVRTQGLRVDSKLGDFYLPQVNVYNDARQMPPVDVALLCTKTTANGALAQMLPALTPEGFVVVLQNGLGVETQVARHGLAGRVAGGVCFLCANVVGPGHVVHSDYGKIKLFDYRADDQPAGVTPRLTWLQGLFAPTGITVECAPDLLLARWQKLVWNIPFNGLTVATGVLTDRIMADAGLRLRAEALMHEVAAAARATCGREITPAFIAEMLEHTEQMTPYKPSMLLDYLAGREMELETMYAEPIRRARAAGCAVPEMERLYGELRGKEQLRITNY